MMIFKKSRERFMKNVNMYLKSKTICVCHTVLFILNMTILCNFVVGNDQEFVLIKAGKALGTIIIGENASDKEKNAALELQRYLEKITGVRMAIKTDAEAPLGYKILIGANKFQKLLKIEIAQKAYPEEERILVKQAGENLVLAGNDAGTYQGTLFSVYTFLEQLGCRWFAPGELWEVIPQTNTVMMPKDLEISERPSSVERRGIWYHRSDASMHSPNAGNELNYWRTCNKGKGAFSGSHSISKYIGQEYFNDHPEYFPLIKGLRTPGQICYTNDDVVDIVVRKLRNYFDQNPIAISASLVEEDNHSYCECEHCREIGGTGKDHISRAQLYFLNRVAKEIKKSHPDKILVFMAYRTGETAEPPIGMKAESNLLVSITSYAVFLGNGYCYYHPMNDDKCPTAVRAREICDGWKQVASQATWSEHINDWGTEIGRPYVHCSKVNIPYMKARNINGYIEESSEHSWLSMGPHNYVVMKLLWNHTLDPDQLIEEYYRLLYGKAGNAVKAYYDALTAALEKKPHAGHTGEILPAILSNAFPACEKNLEQAESAADSDQIKKRIKCLRNYFELLKHYSEMVLSADRWLRKGEEKEREKTWHFYLELEAFSETIKNDNIIAYPIFLKSDLLPWRNVLAGIPTIASSNSVTFTEIGPFSYSEKFRRGGKVLQDVCGISGYIFGIECLLLAPSCKRGEIVYRFKAPDNSVFDKVKLEVSVPDSLEVENMFEISIDNGKTFKKVENTMPTLWNVRLDISKYCANTESFQLRFSSDRKKPGVKCTEVLDKLVISGSISKKTEVQ